MFIVHLYILTHRDINIMDNNQWTNKKIGNREWVLKNNADIDGKDEYHDESITFTAATYNILGEKMIEPGQYLHLPWEKQQGMYRNKLILRDIRATSADIVCLQEVQEAFWQNHQVDLEDMGYGGVYYARSDDLGLGICFKKNIWNVMRHHSYVLDDLARPTIRVSSKVLVRADSTRPLLVGSSHYSILLPSL